MARQAHFSNEFFGFLAELKLNNNREWFQANKDRYSAVVLDPLVDFVADFGEHLRGINPHFVADPRPIGGSIFRIYRDVRFSKDKSPYKTQAAIHFRHEMGREVHGPGYYLHLEPGEVYAGVGLWRPSSESLAKIRDAIVGNPERWKRTIESDEFTSVYQMEGDSLKRAPKGYDPDHPMIGDLKRKDFVAATQFTEEDACEADFIEAYADSCRRAGPFMEFLTKAVGLNW